MLCTAGCSVTVPEVRPSSPWALQVSERQQVQGQAEDPTTATPPAAAAPPSSDATAVQGARPLNRAEEMLPKVNVKPWGTTVPVVVQSRNRDMQCSIGTDAASCHLLNDVAPRPGDVKGQCRGLSEYYGGYAVVTLDGGAQYGLCGNGISPMEAEEVAGPAFPGPWIEDGQTVRIGNMVCSREPGTMVCAHLRTGHGFQIGTEDYELW